MARGAQTLGMRGYLQIWKILGVCRGLDIQVTPSPFGTYPCSLFLPTCAGQGQRHNASKEAPEMMMVPVCASRASIPTDLGFSVAQRGDHTEYSCFSDNLAGAKARLALYTSEQVRLLSVLISSPNWPRAWLACLRRMKRGCLNPTRKYQAFWWVSVLTAALMLGTLGSANRMKFLVYPGSQCD